MPGKNPIPREGVLEGILLSKNGSVEGVGEGVFWGVLLNSRGHLLVTVHTIVIAISSKLSSGPAMLKMGSEREKEREIWGG